MCCVVYLVLVFRHGWLWILDTGDPVKFPLVGNALGWADCGLRIVPAARALVEDPDPGDFQRWRCVLWHAYIPPQYLPSTANK